MNKRLVKFLLKTYAESNVDVAQMSNLLIALFSRHLDTRDINVDDCFILNTLFDMVPTSPIETDYYEFAQVAERLADTFNSLGMSDTWSDWLRAQLDEDSVEIGLVKGCRKLAWLLVVAMQTERYTEDQVDNLVIQLDMYCAEHEILNELLVKEM